MQSSTPTLTEAPTARVTRPDRHLWIWVTLTVVALGLYLGTRCGTPPIVDTSGKAIPGSVASLERVRIGGIDQWVLIRGVNRNNPVLLVLHGGPGLALMPLAYKFQRGLEDDFVVVEWDQRAAGMSYSPTVPSSSLNEEQLISDAREMTKFLRSRFHQPRVFVLGHSWGTYLGMRLIQRYPEMFYAYVGVGQVGDASRIPELQAAFVRAKAQQIGDQQAVQQLAGGDEGARRGLVKQFGGDVHGMTSSWPLVKMALHAPEYDVFDYARYLGGLIFYYRHMPNDLRHAGPAQSVTSVDVPVYFFAGDYDEIAPTVLAREYLDQLRAPKKTLVPFASSAHWPFLEETGKFSADMKRVRVETLGW
ncbi:MAG: alpha/beta hydrolase [Acidobacteria bacterium]|nr:alpha/beta hydrolase [Acidobacteriota bacterium]